MSNKPNDIDPIETQEWLDALSSVLENEGSERAHFLLENLVKYTRRRGVHLPFDATTAYLNTIPAGKEQKSPGNHELEHRIRSIIRWNAAAMVLRAGKKNLELGGHIASFQSAATLYDVGFNHFWRAKNEAAGEEGDLIYIQGRQLPPRGRRQRSALLPAPAPVARLLAVPHRIDGSGPFDGDLSGAFPKISGIARPGKNQRPQSVVFLRRR